MIALLIVPTARADHSDGVYEIPSDAEYPSMTFDVIVIPPEHGQLFNGDGILNGSDPNEIGFNNSYVKATLAAIDEWKNGVNVFGSDNLFRAYQTNVYVVGRDTIPTGVLADPEIVVFTDENEGPLLGTAYHLHPVRVGQTEPGTCLVRSSRMMLVSYTYADMFNIMAQEFGHCLGLGHVGSQGGVDPTSDQKHPEHDVMNGFYADSVGAAGTHLHCVSNLDVAGLEWNLDHPDGTRGISFMPVDSYRTTCDPGVTPPARSTEPSPSPQPEPDPSPSSSPSPSPTSSASPQPEPSDSPQAARMHERSITLILRKHLVARGRVTAADGFTGCESAARVEILRRRAGVEKLVATVQTFSDGSFVERLQDRPGTYIARAAESTGSDGADRCGAAAATARHRH